MANHGTTANRIPGAVGLPLGILTGVMLAAVLLAAACGQPSPETTAPAEGSPSAAEKPAHPFAAAIGEAHGIETWRTKPALESDIVLEFGGNPMLEGKMLAEIGRGRSRFDLKDGTVLVWDGNEAWVSPAASELQGARFHVLTWPYFLAAPMKLQDPGTKLAPLGNQELMGEACETAKLTFDTGVGDTPDDWYVLYQDPQSRRLRGMAYIVTFGKSAEEASKEPHAITYDDYADVGGVTLSKNWTFWLWSEEQGAHGDPLGHFTLNNPRFVEPAPDAFTKPADARPDELPPGTD